MSVFFEYLIIVLSNGFYYIEHGNGFIQVEEERNPYKEMYI